MKKILKKDNKYIDKRKIYIAKAYSKLEGDQKSEIIDTLLVSPIYEDSELKGYAEIVTNSQIIKKVNIYTIPKDSFKTKIEEGFRDIERYGIDFVGDVMWELDDISIKTDKEIEEYKKQSPPEVLLRILDIREKAKEIAQEEELGYHK